VFTQVQAAGRLVVADQLTARATISTCLVTPEGIYLIESPTSLAATMLVGMTNGGNSPILHKAWFMDSLHAGDKVLFSADCNKHNACRFRLPNPDDPAKEIATNGAFEPAVAKTNATSLCGTGKLSASVEAQVCGQAPVIPAAAQPVAPVAYNVKVETAQVAPVAVVSVPAPVPLLSTTAPQQASANGEHQIEGYTISQGGSPNMGSASDTMTLADASRLAKAKKAAQQQQENPAQ
jgi:hypothetical protein